MSFFTNPFAPNTPPVFASSALHPIAPSATFPVPASIRRASQVRSASPAISDASHVAVIVPGSLGQHSKGPPRASPSPPATASLALRKNSSASPSSSMNRSHSHSRAISSEAESPGSRRGSGQSSINLGPCPPTSTSPAPSGPFANAPGLTGRDLIEKHVPDFSRRRSVDVGVLGVHRLSAGSSLSRRVREAVGPDAADKEVGVIGAGGKGGKDRLLGRHLASLLAHSLALCADPVADDTLPQPLAAIPGSPSASPSLSRNTSLSTDSISLEAGTCSTSSDFEPVLPALPLRTGPLPPAFPVVSEAKRLKLIGNLQSWSFNAMSYSPDELLACVGIMFESVRNMAGVDFDLAQLKTLLLSLRSAYHPRNGYHNFSHAADVAQACYSFLVRMGLAPPLYLLCEDDYDHNLGEGRRKWRRNRAVEEGGMGELLRPMDVFALMVAAIGHDVGHPGLSNAYMVNARAPVAQIYHDKSVLENFHTVTLIHMLRKHNFDFLLGGDFGHLGDHATSFRKVLESSILATDMSQHFSFVTRLHEMGKRFGERRVSTDVEADRLLLCAGLMKCADISNPTRPHRISRAWSTALLDEWTVQAAIEADFGLPISVMTLDPADTKAQAKSQVGFIDLFAKPLFTAMASVVDEFHDFAEKMRDGRTAWEAISQQTDAAFSKPISRDWRLSSAPTGHSRGDSLPDETETLHAQSTPASSHATPVPVPGASAPRARPAPLKPAQSYRRHERTHSGGSYSSTVASPSSPALWGSASSSASNGPSSFSSNVISDSASPFSPRFTGTLNVGSANEALLMGKISCGGACSAATAMCAVCSKRENARRGSLGRVLAGIHRGEEQDHWDDEDVWDRPDLENDPDVWPPYPFQPTLRPPAPTI